MPRTSEADRQDAIATLRELLSPGKRVYTNTVHTSASGMTRAIDLYVIKEIDGEARPRRISYTASRTGICSYDNRHEACKVGGCGMDMGFYLVYNLSCTLYPDGFGCIGKGCPSNDHSNGDRDFTPHVQMLAGWDAAKQERTDALVPTVIGLGHWHEDGGYALRHEWLR